MNGWHIVADTDVTGSHSMSCSIRVAACRICLAAVLVNCYAVKRVVDPEPKRSANGTSTVDVSDDEFDEVVVMMLRGWHECFLSCRGHGV